MNALGTFYGIGVGPGEPGLLPVIAWETLQRCAVIYVPRAGSQEASTAKNCLPANEIPEERFREVVFDMSKDHAALEARYTVMAESIAELLRAGQDVAYLTIGDTMTFSTFNYTLRAVRSACPEAPWHVFPGVPCYAALAAVTGFPLGEGKERVQILPCPEDTAELERVIQRNDIVVLMKIGHRLSAVLDLLQSMELLEHAAFGSRIGMPDGNCLLGIASLLSTPTSGYLSTMLIRNPAPRQS